MNKLITILLFIPNLVLAQDLVKEYFTEDDFQTTAEEAYYYRIGKKENVNKKDGVYFMDSVLTFYSTTNQVRSREFYKDGFLEGAFIYYHENGVVKEKGVYEKGWKIGVVDNWYEGGVIKMQLRYNSLNSFQIVNYWDETNKQLIKDGTGYCKCTLPSEQTLRDDRIMQEGNVVDGYRDGVWKGFEGDKLVFTERWKMGNFEKGESLYEGKRIEYDQLFKQSEFKGGFKGMMNFLRINIRYPAAAKRANEQGKVFVKFKIDNNGNLSQLEVIKGVSETLNAEALRVIGLSGPWIPAKGRGVAVASNFVMPIGFRLDN